MRSHRSFNLPKRAVLPFAINPGTLYCAGSFQGVESVAAILGAADFAAEQQPLGRNLGRPEEIRENFLTTPLRVGLTAVLFGCLGN